MNSNRTVVNLNKASYANFFYQTKTGISKRTTRPKFPTVNGERVSKEEIAEAVTTPTGIFYPRETMYERALRRNLIDEWVPHCVLQLSNSHSLTYTGKKALSIWEAWRAKVFGKENK